MHNVDRLRLDRTIFYKRMRFTVHVIYLNLFCILIVTQIDDI